MGYQYFKSYGLPIVRARAFSFPCSSWGSPLVGIAFERLRPALLAIGLLLAGLVCVFPDREQGAPPGRPPVRVHPGMG